MEPKALLAGLVTILFWASAFAGIRAGLAGYGPGHLTLLRFLVASSALLLYARLARIPPPRREDLPRLFLLGVLGITFYHTALNFGERTVSAGAASLLIASGPVFTALLSRFLLGERLSLWGWAGIGLAFLGAALIAFGEGGGVRLEPGAVLILGAALSTSFYFVLQKPLFARYSAREMTVYTLVLGTLPLLVFAPGLLEAVRKAPLGATLSVIYLGLFPGALAYLTWTYALSRTPASRLSSLLYLSPVLAILIGYLWLGEAPSFLALWGGGLALLGVGVVNARGRA
ncbi:DMT family transporter [Thermus filiformis]|uniref:Membrane protein n=1 Tax=Thermus filiformis TaxID=276 RepID=A0A0D6X9J0_THEFI|nr:DMT family transporter [Thermus filiformis]KIX84362.1 membrane protein [Thermus filiformis]